MLIIHKTVSCDLSRFLTKSICMFLLGINRNFVIIMKYQVKSVQFLFVFLIETLTIVLTLIRMLHICNLIRVFTVFTDICVQKLSANMVFPVYNLIDTVDFSVYYSYVFINHLYSHFSVTMLLFSIHFSSVIFVYMKSRNFCFVC